MKSCYSGDLFKFLDFFNVLVQLFDHNALVTISYFMIKKLDFSFFLNFLVYYLPFSSRFLKYINSVF